MCVFEFEEHSLSPSSIFLAFVFITLLTDMISSGMSSESTTSKSESTNSNWSTNGQRAMRNWEVFQKVIAAVATVLVIRENVATPATIFEKRTN